MEAASYITAVARVSGMMDGIRKGGKKDIEASILEILEVIELKEFFSSGIFLSLEWNTEEYNKYVIRVYKIHRKIESKLRSFPTLRSIL